MAKAIFKQLVLTSWRLLLAAGGGTLSGFAMPRANFWIAIFFSVAMMLLSIRGLKFWRAYGIGIIAGIFFYASQSPWMTAYLGPVPWLALAILQGLIFGFGAALSALIYRYFKNPLVVSFALACIWVSREWFASRFPYGGYAWSRLAQTQSDTWLAKYAYLGGLSLISFVVALIAALGLSLFLQRQRMLKIRVTLIAFFVLTPAILTIPVSGQDSAVVAGIQGNADAGLLSQAEPGSNLIKQYNESLVAAKDPKFANVDFVVWPENASDLDPTKVPVAKQLITQLVDSQLAKPLLFGTVNWRGNDVYNTIFQYDPLLGQVDYYDKQRPVPFAEYVPDREFWNLLAPDLISLITHGYSFGTKSGVFTVAGIKAGSLICFEISIDDLMHKLVNEGAQVLISQANNADFGQTDETFQQAALVRLQAIATGRAVVHVSTVGTSFVAQPDGTVTHQIAPFEPGYFIATVPLSQSLTPAEKLYGWVDFTTGIATLAFALIAGWGIRKVKRASHV